MAEKVLVTGATGKVGTVLVRLLLERGVEVKAGTRRPADAEGLLGARVEAVELDYEATETWDEAVQWADRVFLVPPPFDPRSDDLLVPFLDWAVQSGTEHVVLLSAMGAEARERMALRRVEQRIERTGVAWTFLRPNIYMQNFSRGIVAHQIRDMGEVRLPTEDGMVSFVDGRDVAAVAAAVLTVDEHAGRAYTLTGPEALDHYQAAAIISEVSGRHVGYMPVDEDETRYSLLAAGWPEDQAETFSRLMTAIRESRRAGISQDVPKLLGRPATTFQAFSREHAEAWR